VRADPRPVASYLARVLLLGGVYTVVGHYGLRLDAVSNFATLVWAPTGLSLAALLLFGVELWPGVALGALAVNAWNGAPVLVGLGIALGNTLEALIGAAALRRIPGFRPRLDRVVDVLGLIILSAALSTMVSATIGVASLEAGGLIAAASVVETWRAWWLGDAIGALVVTPLLLTWLSPPRPAAGGRRLLEAIVLGIALVGLGWYVLNGADGGPLWVFRQRSSLFPLLIWAALRFGVRGASAATFLISGMAIGATALGRGTFVRPELHQGLELLQAFMAVVALTSLVLAALTAERRRADEERIVHLHRERLSRADAELALQLRDETLAIVSHDLRSPLGAITATAQSLFQHVPDEAARRQLDLVQRAAMRMDRLIGDLLDSAAIGAGRLAIVPQPTRAGVLVREVVGLWQPGAAQQRISLEIASRDGAGGDPETLVTCDRERVMQVLSNLLSNALRFTPPNGRVVISVEVVGSLAQFAVEDNGPGIAAEHLPHLFQRYWQAPNQRGEGTGLGLFIAKGIIEAHGGHIWVDTDRRRGGCTFRFTLPLASVATPAAVSA
jgi:signal transduction histidine kinase